MSSKEETNELERKLQRLEVENLNLKKQLEQVEKDRIQYLQMFHIN